MSEATELARECDRNGLVLPVTDLIISSCALKLSATVITRDRHFSLIPNLQFSTTI